MLFELREYAHAESIFVYNAIDELARAKSELYGKIRRVPTQQSSTTRTRIDASTVVEQEPVITETTFTIPTQDVIDGKLDAFLAELDRGADALLETVMGGFFSYLDRVTHATGNVVSGKDRSFYDSFAEMLEKVELDFNDDGTVAGDYQIVMHPDLYARVAREMADWTPEQTEKLDQIMERKREEAHARRRHRRLS